MRGALVAIYPTLGIIRLQQEGGGQADIRLNQLAEDPAPYFVRWREENDIRDWHWTLGGNRYREDKRGKLLAVCADMNHPGDYLYTLVDENLNVSRGESWGLRQDERALIAARYREQGSSRLHGDPLLAATLEEARRLGAEKGLPVMLLFTADGPAGALPNNALNELENRLALYPEDAPAWRGSMVILPIYMHVLE